MLSERLFDIRTNAEINQAEMAKILGVTQSNYSRWENGSIIIPLKKLNLICNYFNVSMDYVVGLTRQETGCICYDLDAKIIGKNLKTFRKNNHITQRELALFLNTTQSTISSYENGQTLILTAFALQIVNEYKISLDWLCGRTQL